AGCGVIVERILEEPGEAHRADGGQPRLESVTLAFDVDLVQQQPRGPKGDPVPSDPEAEILHAERVGQVQVQPVDTDGRWNIGWRLGRHVGEEGGAWA